MRPRGQVLLRNSLLLRRPPLLGVHPLPGKRRARLRPFQRKQQRNRLQQPGRLFLAPPQTPQPLQRQQRLRPRPLCRLLLRRRTDHDR